MKYWVKASSTAGGPASVPDDEGRLLVTAITLVLISSGRPSFKISSTFAHQPSANSFSTLFFSTAGSPEGVIHTRKEHSISTTFRAPILRNPSSIHRLPPLQSSFIVTSSLSTSLWNHSVGKSPHERFIRIVCTAESCPQTRSSRN